MPYWREYRRELWEPTEPTCQSAVFEGGSRERWGSWRGKEAAEVSCLGVCCRTVLVRAVLAEDPWVDALAGRYLAEAYPSLEKLGQELNTFAFVSVVGLVVVMVVVVVVVGID